MPAVINFLPSTRGFSFINNFPPLPDKAIPTPFGDIAIGDASNGLCGGMVFAVRDYFEANIPTPSGPQPTQGEPLFDFIVDRLFASFDLPNGPTKYYDWMTTSDHDIALKTGLAHRTILDEWPNIKDDLDNNRLSCLALVTVSSLNPGDMGHNHQVLAYGYDLNADNNLTLKVYDPNSGRNDTIYLSLSLAHPAKTTSITHNVGLNPDYPIIRGFFRLPYTWVSPPQIDEPTIPGTVKGMVSTDTGEPIAGATLLARGATPNATTTDTTGHYEFQLVQGIYDLSATAINFQEQRKGIFVGASQTISENFVLSRAALGSITGNISGLIHGVDHNGIRVWAGSHSTRVDNPPYLLPNVEPGQQTVEASAHCPSPVGNYYGSGSVPVVSGTTVTLDLMMTYEKDPNPPGNE